ncbi:hypothetical protein GA0074694_2554 [Micromonospora inyonensis]|uniref:Uncharacterized protein n=2 Tax=Micromonospora inyonensis TaxID=47866 RepID=A0A1C6RPC1_9ACTN|nr:hypothetical protein GA0074694_2554 [Micromonospora inyonensis]
MIDMAEPRKVQRHWNTELTEAAPEQRIGTPRPGHGTIYVHLSGAGERERHTVWAATWEDPFDQPGENGEVAGIATREGSREEVLAWVRSQPAVTLLLAHPDEGWIPLPANDDDVVLHEPEHRIKRRPRPGDPDGPTAS